jgi:hypothetical protein
MTAIEVLGELRSRGIRVEPRPTGNLYLAPKNRLTRELVERVRAHKAEMLVLLRAGQEHATDKALALLATLRAQAKEAEIDRLPRADSWKALPPAGAPAYSILETCQRYGVALRIDKAGDLVVGKCGAKADEPSQPWPELLAEIEAHLEAVARLVEAGWTLKAGFPSTQAA